MVDSSPGKVCFRLYVAGNSPNSQRALDNLKHFCSLHLADSHQTEVVDVLEDPEQALQNKVFLTPQLIIFSPPPVRIIVGNLSDTTALLSIIGQRECPT